MSQKNLILLENEFHKKQEEKNKVQELKKQKIEKQPLDVQKLLENWTLSFVRKAKADQRRASFIKPVKNEARLVKLKSVMRDYHFLENMFLDMKDLDSENYKISGNTAVGGSEIIKQYLEANHIEFGPPYLPNADHKDFQREIQSLQKFVKLNDIYESLQSKMSSLKPYSVISKNSELNKNYKDLKSELGFYKKIDEKNQDGVDVKKEKIKLKNERGILQQEMDKLKSQKSKVKHQSHLLDLQKVEVNHNIKVLQNGIARMLHDFDFENIKDLVNSMARVDPHPLDFTEEGDFLDPAIVMNKEDGKKFDSMDFIQEGDQMNESFNVTKPVKVMDKFEKMKLEIANNTLTSASKQIDSPRFIPKKSTVKKMKKSQVSEEGSEYEHSQDSIATVAFHTKNIQSKLLQRQDRMHTIEQANILLHEIEYFINQNKVHVSKRDALLDSDYRFCLKFKKGDKWMSRDSSLTISNKNLHKIKNQLDKDYEPLGEDQSRMRRNPSLPLIRTPSNLNLLSNSKHHKKKKWKHSSRLFQTEENKQNKNSLARGFRSSQSKKKHKFSLNLSKALKQMKSPLRGQTRGQQIINQFDAGSNHESGSNLHSRSNSKAHHQINESPAMSLISKHRNYNFMQTSGSKISFQPLHNSPQIKRHNLKPYSKNKNTHQRLSSINLKPLKSRSKKNPAHKRQASMGQNIESDIPAGGKNLLDKLKNKQQGHRRSESTPNVQAKNQLYTRKSSIIDQKFDELTQVKERLDSTNALKPPQNIDEEISSPDFGQRKETFFEKKKDSSQNGGVFKIAPQLNNNLIEVPRQSTKKEHLANEELLIALKRQATGCFGDTKDEIIEISAEGKTSLKDRKDGFSKFIQDKNNSPKTERKNIIIENPIQLSVQKTDSQHSSPVNSRKVSMDEKDIMPNTEDREIEQNLSEIFSPKKNMGLKKPILLINPNALSSGDNSPMPTKNDGRQLTFDPQAKTIEDLNKLPNALDKSPKNHKLSQKHLIMIHSGNEQHFDTENDTSLSSYSNMTPKRLPPKSILSRKSEFHKKKSKSSVRFYEDPQNSDNDGSMKNSIHFNLQEKDEIIQDPGNTLNHSYSDVKDGQVKKRKNSLQNQPSLFHQTPYQNQRKKDVMKTVSQNNLAKFKEEKGISETSLINDGNRADRENSQAYKFLTKEGGEFSSVINALDSNRSRTKGKSNTTAAANLNAISKVLSTRNRFLTILNRGHSNIFDSKDVKEQDIYNPNERIDPQETSRMEKSSLLSNTNGTSKKRRKNRLNTALSSHISMTSSYSSFTEKMTKQKSSHHISNPYSRKRPKYDKKPRGAYSGVINPSTVNVIPVEEGKPIKCIKFTVNVETKSLIAVEVEFFNTDHKEQIGEVISLGNDSCRIEEIDFSEGCKVGQVFAGGFDTHLSWFKVTEMYGNWVKTVGFDGWQPNMKYYDGRFNYGEEVGEFWVQYNRTHKAIIGIGFVSRGELVAKDHYSLSQIKSGSEFAKLQ